MKIGQLAFDRLVAQMERAMNVMSGRQQVIASNVANIDTPGYKTLDVDFDAALQEAVGTRGDALPLRTTQPGHVGAQGGPDSLRPARVDDLTERQDGNDVSLEREMMALAATRLRYETAAALVRLRMRQVRSALSEGRTV